MWMQIYMRQSDNTFGTDIIFQSVKLELNTSGYVNVHIAYVKSLCEIKSLFHFHFLLNI